MLNHIQQIEAILNLKLQEAPDHQGNLQTSLIPFKENCPKYALEGDQLVGLNLAKTGLTDAKWKEILALPGLAEHLRALNLCENGLTKFDASSLTSLQDLNLSENPSLEKVSFSAPLTVLERLDLSECQLSSFELPAGFIRLRYLDLRKNGLNQVHLAACNALELLDLSQNALGIFALPGGFDALRYLYLNDNKITGTELNAELPSLEILNLRNNELPELPLDFLDSFPKIQSINVAGNPLPDALRGFLENSSNSLEHIRRFFREMSDGTDIDNECKILLIGNGNVGKSCLVERLVNNRFLEKWESTHAISLQQYPHEDFLLNLWDFGGQDIYHATHRLFMQSNAIYLLLWDWETETGAEPSIREEAGRTRTYENYPLSYWLDYARSLGGEKSPVIVVQTKMIAHLKQDCPGGIREKYPQRFAFFDCDQHIDSKEADKTKNGFKRLLLTIEEALAQLKPKKDIPFKYAEMRRYLRGLQQSGEKYLDLELYDRKAAELKIEEPIGVLENWLTKTGVVFYRQGLFENKIILDQAWAIEAIYTLFNRDEGYYFELERNDGAFTGKDLERYWKDATSSEAERELFLSFMLSCEMCFETTPKTEEYRHVPFIERSFIAPQLLPEEKPRSVQIVERGWENNPTLLHLRFRHDFLHYGIVQSFIVRTQNLANVDDIWKHGILLEEDRENALLESGKNEIRVTTTASGKKLLQKIRTLLHELQDAAAVETVSLDGVNYVRLEQLKKHPPVNPLIESEEGNPVEFKPLSVFLNLDEKAIFDNPASGVMPVEGVLLREEKLNPNYPEKQPTIFFSYAWGDDKEPGESREKIVDELYDSLIDDGFDVRRDKKNLEYAGLISKFMEEIGRGDLVVVFVSDKYAKSPYCMFELYEVARNCRLEKEAFSQKVLPVPVEFIAFDNPEILNSYFDHWEKQEQEWFKLRQRRQATAAQDKRYQISKRINDEFGQLSDWLADMNQSTTQLLRKEDFQKVKQAILDRIGKNSKP